MRIFRDIVSLRRGVMFLILVISLTLTGCDKWSHNGDLDGQWQVMEVLYDNTPIQFPDDGKKYYYNFYLSTVQLSMTGERPVRLKANMVYDKKGKEIIMDFVYVREGKIAQETIDMLAYWGVPQSGEMVADIKELTSSRLVMEYPGVQIVCRKF